MTSAAKRAPRLLWSFVEESLDEAEFLWTRWESALDAHDYTLSEVDHWLERRLFGALDGVLLAGAAAIEPLLVPALSADEPGRVSAAAYVLGALGSLPATNALFQGLHTADAKAATALGRALARLKDWNVLEDLGERSSELSPHGLAALVDAFTFKQRAPSFKLESAFESSEPELPCAALGALPYLPTRNREALLRGALSHPVAAVRNAAIQHGVRSGSALAWHCCREIVHSADPDRGPLLLVAALLGDAHDIGHIVNATEDPTLRRDALWALGFAGTRASADACIPCLHDDANSRAAAEAFAAITGLDLIAEGFRLPETEPSTEDSGSDEDLEGDLIPSPDLLLPAPQPAAIEAWWSRARPQFDETTSYQQARPRCLASLRHALLHGPTRRRHAQAYALCARTAGALDLQTRAFCAEQARAMGELAELGGRVPQTGARALGVDPLAER